MNGVRMALSAAGIDVLRMVLRDALWMVCAGLAIGAPLAFWGKRVAAGLIPDLPVGSFLPFVVAAAMMIAVGLIAAYLPARRAMRVDPMVALRYQCSRETKSRFVSGQKLLGTKTTEKIGSRAALTAERRETEVPARVSHGQGELSIVSLFELL